MYASAIEEFVESFSEILEVKIPVNTSKLAHSLNGEIHLVEHMDMRDSTIEKLVSSAHLHSKSTDSSAMQATAHFKITTSVLENDVESRLELAHKLGHLFLHMGYLINENKWSEIHLYNDSAYYRLGHSIEEYEANLFAKALLLPRREFFETAKGNLTGEIYDVEEISVHFGVPVHLVKERGRDLGLFSTCSQ